MLTPNEMTLGMVVVTFGIVAILMWGLASLTIYVISGRTEVATGSTVHRPRD